MCGCTRARMYAFEHSKEVLIFVESVTSNVSPTGFFRDRKQEKKRHLLSCLFFSRFLSLTKPVDTCV